MILSDNDKMKIEMAVRAVESTTSGEVVPVFLKQSDLYPASHFRLAVLFSMIVPIVCFYAGVSFSHPLWPIFIQFPSFIVGYLLAFEPTLKRFFTLKSEIEEEVYQKALQLFFENKLSSTKDRTGILILVSLLEHKVEIVADVGINQKVPKDTWPKILIPFISQIKKGELVDGMVDIITTCGELLSQHFPRENDDTNELSNKVITE